MRGEFNLVAVCFHFCFQLQSSLFVFSPHYQMKTRTNQKKYPPSAALAAMAEAKAAKAKESADNEVIVLSSDSEGEDDFAAGGTLIAFVCLSGHVSSCRLSMLTYFASHLSSLFRFTSFACDNSHGQEEGSHPCRRSLFVLQPGALCLHQWQHCPSYRKVSVEGLLLLPAPLLPDRG